MTIYHLYSDGNYFPRAKKSGFGGYISTPTGEIIVEYSEQIKEKKYSYSYELLGIIRGLQIAKENGIDNIISHCDDKTTSKKLKEFFELKNTVIPKNLKIELFNQVVELFKYFKNLKFEYIPREQNKYADALSRKYAYLLEENFIKQYNTELAFSQKKFEQGIKTNKRLFFSHSSIITNPHKNNPFLVAPIRNKKIRKISREQQRDSFDYLYFETFKQKEKLIIKSFNYDNYGKIKDIQSYSFSLDEDLFKTFLNIFILTTNKLKNNGVKNLWISSNYREMNAYLEQKDKIPHNTFDTFSFVHQSLTGFNKVFFNNLPFEHKFTLDIAPTEKIKQRLDFNIETLDSLMEQLSNSELSKDKNKYFGAIIRHQLRGYKSKLERELNSIEINNIIEETIISLNSQGYKNLPKPNEKHRP